MDEQDKRIFEEMLETMPGDLKAAFDAAWRPTRTT
jgi:hypothetical protein